MIPSQENALIPKTTIRCNRSRSLLTPAMLENEARLIQIHPDWEHLFFNHFEARDWVIQHAPEFEELYEFYPIDRQREQLFRWLALRKYGGFWMNPNLRLEHALDSLREYRLALACQEALSQEGCERLHRDPHREGDPLIRIADYCFGMIPGHPFAEAVLEELIIRAGVLDGGQPTKEEEEFTTGAGVINAVFRQAHASESRFILIRADEDETGVEAVLRFGVFGFQYEYLI